MKTVRLWFSIVLLFIGLGALWVACDTAARPAPSLASETLAHDVKLPSGGVLPAGTRVQDAVTASGEKILRFDLPATARLFVEGNGGVASRMLSSGGIRCSCTSGTGCSLFRGSGPAGTTIGCAVTGSCTACQMTVQQLRASGEGVLDVVPGRTTLINLARGIQIVSSSDQRDSLACASEALLREPAVRDSLRAFLSNFQFEKPMPYVVSENTPASSYFMMPVDLYGTVLRVPVPSTQVGARFLSYRTTLQDPASESFDPDAEVDGPARCRCVTGGSGCLRSRYSAPLIGTVEICLAGPCPICEMNF